MVTLSCPLCCKETFTTHSSLKHHILNILENLSCPSCENKFDNFEDLTSHLDNCRENDCSSPVKDVLELVEIEKNTNIEVTDDEDSKMENSILARALLANSPEGSPLRDEDGEGDVIEHFCQICSLSLTDMEAHLKQFHDGQEVVVVMEHELEEANRATEENATILVVNSSGEESGTEINDKNTDTVNEENIKDKDGRLYTRKIVKIEKFWLNENSDSEDANLPKFLITGHSVAKTSSQAVKTQQKKIRAALKKHEEGPFDCAVCNTTFPTFKSLRLHRRMHNPVRSKELTPEEGLTFQCPVCKKTYDKKFADIHMSSHDTSNSFNCRVCNRKFFTETNLEMHMKAHNNNKKFSCSYCKKPFVTFEALKEHVLNQCQKRLYACQYCGRRFARPHEKVKHERIHTGEKPHVCEICGKAFRVSYCLTLHLRTHSGTRPYECKACGKRFKSHSVYNHHLLTHSDVRAYKCPFCPKAFKTSVQLAGHKNSHTKPFSCTECNRPFASLYAVRGHMETHKRSNNLRYECQICGAQYSRASPLKDHLKQHHQQGNNNKVKPVFVNVEDVESASSALKDDDLIIGLDGADIEIMDNEAE